MTIISFIKTNSTAITLAGIFVTLVINLIKDSIIAVLKKIYKIVTMYITIGFNNKKSPKTLTQQDLIPGYNSVSHIINRKNIKWHIFKFIQVNLEYTEEKKSTISKK